MNNLAYGSDGYDGYGLNRIGFNKQGRTYCPIHQCYIGHRRCGETRGKDTDMPEMLDVLEEKSFALEIAQMMCGRCMVRHYG